MPGPSRASYDGTNGASTVPVLRHRAHAVSRRLAAVGLAVLVGAGGQALAASRAHAATAADGFVTRINAARHEAGRSSYVERADLDAVALAQARRMAERGAIYHNPNLATDVRDWRYAGENVGVGPDVSTLHAAFMASPGHRANVLDHDFTEVGVGVVSAGGRLWVAEVFRQPLHATAASRVPATSAHRAATRRVVHRHPVLTVGSHGGPVVELQRDLGIRATGYFGTTTRSKVRTFQRRHHLRVTGVVDAKTWHALS